MLATWLVLAQGSADQQNQVALRIAAFEVLFFVGPCLSEDCRAMHGSEGGYLGSVERLVWFGSGQRTGMSWSKRNFIVFFVFFFVLIFSSSLSFVLCSVCYFGLISALLSSLQLFSALFSVQHDTFSNIF